MTTSDIPQDDSLPDLQQYLSKIYEQGLTPLEFQGLRDEADKVFERLTTRYPANGYLVMFQQLADIAVQALQKGTLEIKKQKPSSDDKQLLEQAYGFQVAYIKACLDRFTQKTP